MIEAIAYALSLGLALSAIVWLAVQNERDR